MLTDQELQNLAPRGPVEEDNNVFEDSVNTPAVSPHPTPGIILTVEGSPDIVEVEARHRSTRRSSRRTRQSSNTQHRSPSTSRMSSTRQQQNGQKLRDPYLSGAGVSRSQSMRTARRPHSVDPTHKSRHRISSIPNDLTLPSDGYDGQRLSSNQSLPLPDDDDFLRLRNFAVTSKGVVNRGDSFRSKSRSSHSVASVGVGGQIPITPTHHKDESTEDHSSSSAKDCIEVETIEVEGASAACDKPKNKYKVLVLGPSDVGKTALINQFMTSEYMCAYDNSQGYRGIDCPKEIRNTRDAIHCCSNHKALDNDVFYCSADCCSLQPAFDFKVIKYPCCKTIATRMQLSRYQPVPPTFHKQWHKICTSERDEPKSKKHEEKEKTVPVILNGSESELVFLEHQFTGDVNTNFCEFFNPDAYLVVYSVTSKSSLHMAKEALKLIHKWDNVHSKALILVGNKTDLARHRVLSTNDGRSLAIEESSKFIETSAGINHQIDDLLVGILSQIRLKRSSYEKSLQKRESVSLASPSSGSKFRGSKCSGCSGCKAKGLLKRIMRKACSGSKSCDNLHVL